MVQMTLFGDGGREGGAGIPFPRTPFPSRPARALGWEAAALACPVVSSVVLLESGRGLSLKESSSGVQ